MEDAEEQLAVWAADPERIDPDDYPASSPFAKEITWAPCPECAVQVHLPVSQFVFQGLRCPRCARTLLSPPDDPEGWLRRILREEDEFSEQL